jgi:hypothetical protein
MEKAMLTVIMRLARYVWANLGRCPLCTRKAFLATLAAWIITIGASITVKPSIWLSISTICALLLTMLWMAHIVAFSLKSSSASKFTTADFDPARREIFSIFAKTAVTAAFASALPTISYAQGRGQNCAGIGKCPDGAPYCCSKPCGFGRTAHACCAAANCTSIPQGACIVPC